MLLTEDYHTSHNANDSLEAPIKESQVPVSRVWNLLLDSTQNYTEYILRRHLLGEGCWNATFHNQDGRERRHNARCL